MIFCFRLSYTFKLGLEGFCFVHYRLKRGLQRGQRRSFLARLVNNLVVVISSVYHKMVQHQRLGHDVYLILKQWRQPINHKILTNNFEIRPLDIVKSHFNILSNRRQHMEYHFRRINHHNRHGDIGLYFLRQNTPPSFFFLVSSPLNKLGFFKIAFTAAMIDQNGCTIMVFSIRVTLGEMVVVVKDVDVVELVSEVVVL